MCVFGMYSYADMNDLLAYRIRHIGIKSDTLLPNAFWETPVLGYVAPVLGNVAPVLENVARV